MRDKKCTGWIGALMAELTFDAMLPDAMAMKKAPFALVLLGTHSGREQENCTRVDPG